MTGDEFDFDFRARVADLVHTGPMNGGFNRTFKAAEKANMFSGCETVEQVAHRYLAFLSYEIGAPRR